MSPCSKIAVFGIGGAGCKIAGNLAEMAPEGLEIGVIDKDERDFAGLPESVKRIDIGQAVACKNGKPSEVKEAVSRDIKKIEDALEGADIAIIIASLGGKTGACLAEFVSEACENMGVTTIFVPIYPASNMGMGTDFADSVIKRMRKKADAVLIIDNNLKLRSSGKPMLYVFREVNRLVVELVLLISHSVMGLGDTSLGEDGVRRFFCGEKQFIVTSGREVSLKRAIEGAINEAGMYAEKPMIKRALALVSSPRELDILEMRELNTSMRRELNIDDIEWSCSYVGDGYNSFILVAEVGELPLVDGVELPAEIEPEGPVSIKEETPYPKGEFEVLEKTANVIDKSNNDLFGGIMPKVETGKDMPGLNVNPLPEWKGGSARGRFKRQALIGINREKPRDAPKVKEEPVVVPAKGEARPPDDVWTAACELSGHPPTPKPKEKEKPKKDNFGIEYI